MPQFQFQTIHHGLRSKIPIVTDTHFEPILVNWDFYKTWKSSLWLMVSSKRKSGEGSLQCHSRGVKWTAFPSPSPAFLDLLVTPVSLLLGPLKGVHNSQEGWAVRGELEQPYCRTSLTAELSGEGDGISSMCSPKMQKGGVYTKPCRNLGNPLRSCIPFKGSIVSHPVMHSAYTSC